jgi:uncharacterized protein (DUF58 family)
VIERTLRRLELAVTRRLDGLLVGDHLGLIPGSGTEKAESREYRFGDDVRRMDWSVTARTTVPHVHDLIADRELETWVVVDLSASMEFGTALAEKRELAIAMVAAVGHLTARTGNRTGAIVVSGAGTTTVPARPGRDGLRALLRVLMATPRTAWDAPVARPDAGAATDLAAAVGRLEKPRRRRGLAVVISDFLTPDLSWERPLRALASRHQLLAVEIRDPGEMELPNVGHLTVVDPETGARLEVPTGSRRLRERYARAAAEHRDEVSQALRRAGAGHLVLHTDRDWISDVVRYVSATRRGAGAARRGAGAARRGAGAARRVPAGRAPAGGPGRLPARPAGAGPARPAGAGRPAGAAR